MLRKSVSTSGSWVMQSLHLSQNDGRTCSFAEVDPSQVDIVPFCGFNQ